jgi:hypothetical protein
LRNVSTTEEKRSASLMLPEQNGAEQIKRSLIMMEIRIRSSGKM